jgi:hypothetical protein
MNPDRKPIILSTFSIGVIWQTWVNYYAGIWYADFNGIYSLLDAELSYGIQTKLFSSAIGAVQEDGTSLTQVFSIASLLSEPSFYWDHTNKILYIRLEDYDSPSTRNIKIGINVNIATETYIDYVNGITYLPDLKNIPPLTQNKDRLFFKKIQNRVFSMIVNNANLTYDDIKNWDVYNQKVQYYFGYHDQLFADFQKIRSGLIRDFSFSGEELSINIQDIRSQLTARIPANTFTVTKYPDLDPDFSGDMIPLSFGKVKNAPIKVVNSEDGTGPYIYKIADTEISPIHAINQVYVDGAVVTHANENLTDATFTLTSVQVKDGTTFKEVTCDHEGYKDGSGNLIENPLDIIVYLLSNYLSIPYNNVRYNTVEWATERIGKPPVAKYITSKIQIKTIIEELTTSIRGGFFDEGDARFTFRTVNVDQLAALIIRDSDWINTPDVSIDTTEMLAFVRIGYNKDYGKNKQKTIQDTEDKANVEQSFGIYDDETFNTLLRDKTDAEGLATDIMDLSNSPAIIVKGKTGLENAFAKIGKIFSADVNRFVDGEYQEWYGNLTGEILSVAPDILNETTEVILRVIPGAGAEEEFAAAIYGIGIYGLTMYGVTK